MEKYLLLHGAMRGAWLWHKVTPLLKEEGAAVIAYDLPGHGSRAAERTAVTMSTYIDDVLSYIGKNDLRDLVLVGHSMSGIIITSVAERVPDRISRLVYVAAVVPRDGDALIDLLPEERQETLRKMAGTVPEIFGSRDTLRSGYFTDLAGVEQDFYLNQLTPQPLAVFFEKVRVQGFYGLRTPRRYVLGLQDKALPPALTRGFAERLGVKPVVINAGHDMMVVKAREVADALSGRRAA